MARKPRLQVADVVYHVGSRGVERRPIFDVIRGDRAYFFVLLAQTVTRYQWLVHAYCLMGNHFHLVVETPQANLAAGMQYLKGRYAIWFNEAYAREGALFERRYFSELVATEAHVYELMRYVVLNPVRANLCAHPREWPSSSYAATVGAVEAPPFLDLRLFHDLYGPGPRGITLFEKAVEDGMVLTELQRAA
jgi:REP element-mobilizing transposase RayT